MIYFILVGGGGGRETKRYGYAICNGRAADGKTVSLDAGAHFSGGKIPPVFCTTE